MHLTRAISSSGALVATIVLAGACTAADGSAPGVAAPGPPSSTSATSGWSPHHSLAPACLFPGAGGPGSQTNTHLADGRVRVRIDGLGLDRIPTGSPVTLELLEPGTTTGSSAVTIATDPDIVEAIALSPSSEEPVEVTLGHHTSGTYPLIVVTKPAPTVCGGPEGGGSTIFDLDPITFD